MGGFVSSIVESATKFVVKTVAKKAVGKVFYQAV